MPRILDAALSTVWAITPDGLDSLRSIYEQALSRTGNVTEEMLVEIMRGNEDLAMSLHLTEGLSSDVQMQQGIRYAGTKYGTMFANGVVVLDLIGPIYPRANMMTSSGAVSVQQFTSEFVKAYNDPEVKGIVMNIDSPGGDARGLGDASQLMYGLSKKRKKPVKAFASGYMASAAYYLGAVAQEIIGSKSSITGSIGTVLGPVKAPKEGEYEIVSSQSPHKRPDPSTEDGRSVMQQLVDDMAQNFIEDVAMFRNVSVETVLSDYGQGKTLVGPRAKKQGLIDGIGTLSSVVESVAKEAQDGSYRQVKNKRKMSASVAEILSFTSEEINDMGLLDLAKKFRASNQVIADAANIEEQAQPESVTDESDSLVADEGQGHVEDSTPETPAVLSQEEILAQREELENRFSEAAELFATQMTIDNRIYPAQQGYAASDLLIARIDDSIFGGVVNHINAEGNVVAGTREEAVRARYAVMPKHTMTQKAIAGVKAKSVVANVLAEEDKEEKAPKAGDDSSEIISDERRAKLMGLTTQGQKALARSSN